MRKLLFIILAAVLLLSACGESLPPLSDSNNTDTFITYYKSADKITDWRVISALYLENQKLSDYNIVLESDGSKFSDCAAAFSGAVLTKLWESDKYDCAQYIESAKAVLDDYESHDTAELCMAILALNSWDDEHNNTKKVVEYLQSIQLMKGGWGTGSESTLPDAYTSALVLCAYKSCEQNYKDNASWDGLIEYLDGSIGNEFTVADADDKESSKYTAAVLYALIYAGVPADGETAAYLCNAIEDFKTETGYSMYKDDKKDSEDAMAEIFLAYASTRRAGIFQMFEPIS